MDSFEELRQAAETGFPPAIFNYNRYALERGRTDALLTERLEEYALEILHLNEMPKLKNFASIPVLLHILRTAPINNYKLLAAIWLIELKVAEAAPIFLDILDKSKQEPLSSNEFRNKLIDGLVEFRVMSAFPVLKRILLDTEESDDIRGQAAKALVVLTPDSEDAAPLLIAAWESGPSRLQWALMHAFRNNNARTNRLNFIEILSRALADENSNTRHMAATSLIATVLDYTSFGHHKNHISASELYQLDRPTPEEHRIVAAIKSTEDTSLALKTLYDAGKRSLFLPLLFVCRIIRHFPKKAENIRAEVKAILRKEDPHRTYNSTKAIEIALKLKGRERPHDKYLR